MVGGDRTATTDRPADEILGPVDLTPEDLEKADFASAESGFDPDAVRDLLSRAAERLREVEREGVKSVSGSVSAVLDQAVKSSEELVATATSDAEAIRATAESDATRIGDDAAAVAAGVIAEGEKAAAERVDEADGQVEDILAKADADARDRSAKVINDAQQRLDRLLAAERDVHDRLQAAMADIHASVGRVGVSQDAELALTVEDPEAEPAWADDGDEVAKKRKSA